MRNLVTFLTTMGFGLRIIQINDVYELDCLPSFKTLIDKHRKGTDKLLVVLAGDFLAPSLLSSLDKGAGMVDCLTACGVTHVCFGNHECDIPVDALPRRIEQSGFAWINTNMQELNEKLDLNTPTHEVITVSDGTKTKKVGLLGLLTDDPSLYRPGAFANAKIEPVLSMAEIYVDKLKSEVDLVVPMTHQGIEDDRVFAKHFGGNVFPVIIGGHDHEPFDETHNGARIIKTGFDAHNASVIDFEWDDSDKLQVKVRLMPTSNFHPDPDMVSRVECHEKILQELEKARLFCIRDWKDKEITECLPGVVPLVFSTRDNRLGPSIGSTALTTILRMGMRAQVALCNAGSIRGNKIYPDDSYFTMSDLKAEMPFPSPFIVASIPGQVLQDTIAHSRRMAVRTPPVASGGYLHTCNNMIYNDDKECIESILKEPFDPKRKYLTALPVNFFKGIDNHVPLLKWAKESQFKFQEDSAIPSKMIVVEVFSAILWLQLGSFEEIDGNKDGVITRDEVKDRVNQIYTSDVAELVLNNVMSVADMSGDGTISPLEMMIVQFVATDIISHVCTQEELKAMKEVASQVLGKDPSHDDVKEMVIKIRDTLDLAQDGTIHRDEVMKALGTVSDEPLTTGQR